MCYNTPGWNEPPHIATLSPVRRLESLCAQWMPRKDDAVWTKDGQMLYTWGGSVNGPPCYTLCLHSGEDPQAWRSQWCPALPNVAPALRDRLGPGIAPWDGSRNSSKRIQLLYNASMMLSDTVGPCRPRCRPCLDSLADVTPRDSTILRDPTIAAIPRHIFGLSLGVLHSMWHWDVAMHWCGEPQCGRCEPYRGPAGPA